MFNVGGGEMVLLAVLALLVFGPEGLPGIIKTVARTVKAFRQAANDFQAEVNTALALETQKQQTEQRRRNRPHPPGGLPLAGESTPPGSEETVPVKPEPVAQAGLEAETEAETAGETAGGTAGGTAPAPTQAAPTAEAASVPLSLNEVASKNGTVAPELSTPANTSAEAIAAAEPASEAASAREESTADDDGPGLPMTRPVSTEQPAVETDAQSAQDTKPAVNRETEPAV